MTYIMTEPCYVGLPSGWYLGRIEAGFSHWGLPQAELERAFRETHLELVALGVDTYVPDGRKRMKAVDRDGLRRAAVRAAQAPGPIGSNNFASAGSSPFARAGNVFNPTPSSSPVSG
jgi:hypothetical protein